MKNEFNFSEVTAEDAICAYVINDEDIVNHRSHLSQYNYLCVQLMVKNSSEYNRPGIKLCFTKENATQCFAYKLLSGYRLTIIFPLRWLNLHSHFLPPTPGVLKGHKLDSTDNRLWLPEQTEHISAVHP
ncbi:MAG: hypothetical protein SCM11_01805 [Bacillota bacterium]|nr:hypothetical protein [Bacillota bacterium]